MIDIIRVCGITYHISEASKNELGPGKAGVIDNYTSEIKVLKDLSPQARKQALWRLVVYLIAENSGLELSDGDLAAIGNGVCAVMVDNLGFR